MSPSPYSLLLAFTRCLLVLLLVQVPVPKIAVDGHHLTFVALAAVLRHVTQRTLNGATTAGA